MAGYTPTSTSNIPVKDRADGAGFNLAAWAPKLYKGSPLRNLLEQQEAYEARYEREREVRSVHDAFSRAFDNGLNQQRLSTFDHAAAPLGEGPLFWTGTTVVKTAPGTSGQIPLKQYGEYENVRHGEDFKAAAAKLGTIAANIYNVLLYQAQNDRAKVVVDIRLGDNMKFMHVVNDGPSVADPANLFAGWVAFKFRFGAV